MNERERLLRALKGEPVDRAPVICPGGMMTSACREVMEHTGFKWPAVHRDARSMAGLSLAMHREAGLENIGIPFCMTVESEAWGGEVELGDEVTPPSIHTYAMRALGEWSNLKHLDPEKDGRLPVMLECTRIVRAAAPDTAVMGNLVGPVSLATSLIDASLFYRALRTDAAEVHAFLSFLAENCIRYGRALLKNGADVMVISDPSATGEILGPKLFREFALPWLNRMTEELGAPTIVHICGDVAPIHGPLKELKADALSVDCNVSVEKLRSVMPGKRIMGNISTLLLQEGPVATIREVSRRAGKRVDIVAPACGMSATTPIANLRAMTDAARGA